MASPGVSTRARQPAPGVPAKPPRTADPVDDVPARRGRDGVVDEHAQHPVGDEDVAPAGQPLAVVRRRAEGAWVGRVVDEGDRRGGDRLADTAGEERPSLHDGLARQRRRHDAEQGRHDARIEHDGAATRASPSARRACGWRAATASSIASSAMSSPGPRPTLKPRAGLGVGALAGDGVDGEKGRRTPPVRRDAGGRGQRHLGHDCPSNRPRTPGGRGGRRPGWRARARSASSTFFSIGVDGDAVVPQVELGGGDAVGLGEDHVGVGGGEAGVVPGVGQGGGDHVGVERAGPGETDAAADDLGVGAVGIEEDADADAGRVGRRQRLDLALVGPDLGLGAAGRRRPRGLSPGLAWSTTRTWRGRARSSLTPSLRA